MPRLKGLWRYKGWLMAPIGAYYLYGNTVYLQDRSADMELPYILREFIEFHWIVFYFLCYFISKFVF